MKEGNKIALFYTAVTICIITVAMLVVYLFVSFYIHRMEASHLILPEHGKSIQHLIGWLLVGLLFICILPIYLIGRHYASKVINRIDTAYHSEKTFISSASHELNNPLTAIQGECEISLMKERTPAEYQAALGRISAETKRIIQLMKHLLFLSQGDKEILKNAIEPIFLADFLMQFTGSRVSFSPDSFAFVIEANPNLLKIAINNLLNNALKYSDNKPVEMFLRGNTLEIKDYGIGIPPEDLEHIYQPFYRAGNVRGYNGHGIGLSLSLRILSTYGAKVHISSKQNEGTTVSIDFPY